MTEANAARPDVDPAYKVRLATIARRQATAIVANLAHRPAGGRPLYLQRYIGGVAVR